MATYRGNDAVTVKSVNKSGNMVLECEVFGYRKLQVPLNFNNPDSVEGVTSITRIVLKELQSKTT